MLVFKDVSNENELLEFLDQNNIVDIVHENGLFFGGYEDEKLFGIAEAYYDEGKLFLGVIKVSPLFENQRMEEAIMRSLLNKLELNGNHYIYSWENEALHKSVNFEEDGKFYRCDLKALFNKGCSCCGGDVLEV